jgi:UDP-hydrolysing UDP-N-acetyl-D-glucosamine 2-epimerase
VRTVGVVTVGRSDWSLWLPLLRRLARTPGVRAEVYASGAHTGPGGGTRGDAIEAEGMRPRALVPWHPDDDTPRGAAAALGRGVEGFSRAFAEGRPDVVAVLGDRIETFAAAAAAAALRLPVAHLHGGEVTEGSLDDAWRHAITKLSHLHLVAAAEYGRRVLRLGEEPWRVRTVGALGLDALAALEPLPRDELGRRLGLPPGDFLLATYHPDTVGGAPAGGVAAVLEAIGRVGMPVLLTAPNLDPGREEVRRALEAHVAGDPRARLVEDLGPLLYGSAMARAAAMVGNSSSGLLEAGWFGLPVVNVGTRQKGRLRGPNVVDVEEESPAAVEAGLRRALDPAFRASLSGRRSPFGDGRAAERIAEALATVPLDERLLRKRFVDAEERP